jgi:amidohydrolase
MDIKSHVQACKDRVIAVRRDLHRIPELAYTEEKTSAYAAEYLQREGLAVTTGIARTGVVGLLETGRPGPCLLIRADMDALPIAEKTGLPFASEHPGVMHACGHDGNVAMALVAATAMNAIKDRIDGRIKFVFQPAEEGPGGAKPMIEAGVMEDPHRQRCRDGRAHGGHCRRRGGCRKSGGARKNPRRRGHGLFPGKGAGSDAYAGIHNPRFDFNIDCILFS